MEEAKEDLGEVVLVVVLPNDVKLKSGVGAVLVLDAEHPEPTLAAAPDDVLWSAVENVCEEWATKRVGGVPGGDGWRRQPAEEHVGGVALDSVSASALLPSGSA